MGFTRFPPRVRIAIAVAAAAILTTAILGFLVFGRAGDSSTSGTTLPYIPADRDLTENPDAIIKKEDMNTAFGVTFRLYQENPVKAQGVQYNFTETHGRFTASVLEVKGEEAAATWQRLTTEFAHPDAPGIGLQAKFEPDLVVAVYENDVFVSVTLTDGEKPADGKALHQLGILARQRILAMSTVDGGGEN